MNDLKRSESSLTQELKINNQKRREIARAVKKAIEDEIKAIEKKTKSKFNLTPEGIALSADFKKNKGKLAWPVARGKLQANMANTSIMSLVQPQWTIMALIYPLLIKP